MIRFVFVLGLAAPLLALAAPTPLQGEEREAVKAYLEASVAQLRDEACRARVPAYAAQHAGTYRDWRAARRERIAHGEVVMRRDAPQLDPSGSADAMMARMSGIERAQLAALDAPRLEEACAALVEWMASGARGLPPTTRAEAADRLRPPTIARPSGAPTFRATNGTFEFDASRFASTFIDSRPLQVDAEPRASGDMVRFTSNGGPFPFVFEVGSWATGADAVADLARVEAAARTLPGLQSARARTPCPYPQLAPSCLSIQDIVYEGKLPRYARDSVVFQSGGWTYSISASNFGPTLTVTSEDDLAGFKPAGSVGNATMALKSFVDAFRALPAPVPAAD